jgi:hypothetical protein
MKKASYTLLLSAIFISHLLINYQILSRSQAIRVSDEAHRIFYVLRYYQELLSSSNTGIIKKFDCILSLDKGQGHPHLFEFTAAVSWKILDALKIRYKDMLKDINLMILVTNSLFLLILIISMYRIGSILYNKNIGLLSALFTSIFPLVFGQSRNAMLDFPLMAMISLSIYLLLRTNGFCSILYSIFVGVSLGLSQLTKESAIIFIFAPLIYYFLKSYAAVKKKKVILNFMITILVFTAVSAILYLRPSNQHIFKTYFCKIYYIRNNPDFLYYFKAFKEIIGPYILVLSLPLLLSYFANFKKREKLLFFWFFVPIILFTVSPNRSFRFILPVFPAFSLIIIQEIFNNNLAKLTKRIICFVFIFFSILQYALFNCGFLGKNTIHYLEQGILSVKKDPYLHDASTLLDILKEKRAAMENSRITTSLFLFHVPQFSHFIAMHGFNINSPLESDKVDASNYPFDCAQDVLNADYIIDSVPMYPFFEHHQKTVSCLRDNFTKYKDNFKMIAEIKVFDGHVIQVYENTNYKY